MDENVYQHFRKSEIPFIDQVGNWMQEVSDQYRPVLTDFLDPRQMFILSSLLGEHGDLHFAFDGGYIDAERKRALIYPDYYEPTADDYEISLFEIKYPVKFAELSHGKILGTLVNLGIKRDSFGDIMTDDLRWQFFVESNMADYINSQVSKIGKVAVHLEERSYTDLIMPKDAWTDEQSTVSSMRLDTVIADVYNISRQRSKELVETGKVKLNWQVVEKPDFEIDLLDIISVRGFGRIQLREVLGKTKKDKHRVNLGVLRK